MDYRTEITTLSGQTVQVSCSEYSVRFIHYRTLKDNPLLSLFDAIEDQQSEPGRRFCCAQCQAAITTEKDKIEVNSRHTFQLTNPSGVNFNVACFKDAWGCGIYGDATDIYTWFPGFSWQFAYCLGCQEHLGWYYQNSSEQHFFGLVADKLMPAQDG